MASADVPVHPCVEDIRWREHTVCGMARGAQQERVVAEGTRFRFGDGVEGVTLPVAQGGQHCAMRVTAEVDLVAKLGDRPECPKAGAQTGAVVQYMLVQENVGVIVVALEEQTLIALCPRSRQCPAPSSSGIFDISMRLTRWSQHSCPSATGWDLLMPWQMARHPLDDQQRCW